MRVAVALVITLFVSTALAEAPVVRVGSKKFTESVVLGEVLGHLARAGGARVFHHSELGGTRVLWNATRAGEIDVYVEYTGTLTEEIFAGKQLANEQELRAAIEAQGLRMSRPLGFNNTYALGLKKQLAARRRIKTVSDLADHPDLVFGFTNEFMQRGDGWPGLKERYSLPQKDVGGMDHDLAYRGLESGSIQVMDLYSTDAEIKYYDLQVLYDDQRYFPDYQAVIVYRADLERRVPQVVVNLRRLEGRIDAASMQAMNKLAKIDKIAESKVAADFVTQTLGVVSRATTVTVAARLWRRTREHLFLVAVSLFAALLLAVPLGVLAARTATAGQVILGVVATVQTIPSLALLVFMIPLVGMRGPPAIVALFLYSLLPIVRNTHAGLCGIPAPLRESAEALGLPSRARLFRIELPLATPSILAGIKTAAVINVGTATLGALVGAGGYGQPILTGIRLDDTSLILQGAVPAAVLALLAQGLFEIIERYLVPRGLRARTRWLDTSA